MAELLPHPDSYTYKTEWSQQDGEFLSTVAEFPSLSWLAKTPEGSIAGLKGVVVQTLTDLHHSGGTIPRPAPRFADPVQPYGMPYGIAPTMQMPQQYANNPQAPVMNQSVNVQVGGGGPYYYKSFNHTLHFIIFVLTGGLWIFGWIPLWIMHENDKKKYFRAMRGGYRYN